MVIEVGMTVRGGTLVVAVWDSVASKIRGTQGDFLARSGGDSGGASDMMRLTVGERDYGDDGDGGL